LGAEEQATGFEELLGSHTGANMASKMVEVLDK